MRHGIGSLHLRPTVCTPSCFKLGERVLPHGEVTMALSRLGHKECRLKAACAYAVCAGRRARNLTLTSSSFWSTLTNCESARPTQLTNSTTHAR